MKMLQTGSTYLSPAPDIMTDKWPWRHDPPTFQQWVAPLQSRFKCLSGVSRNNPVRQTIPYIDHSDRKTIFI